MKIQGSVAFVTGANRGLGRQFAEQLLARGAKVYAGARNPETVTLDGVIPVRIDITDPASVQAAAELAADPTILVNNAGTTSYNGLLDGPMDDIRAQMESHFFGTLNVTRAFVPHLVANAPRRDPEHRVDPVVEAHPRYRGIRGGQGRAVGPNRCCP